ncbi:MAG TPA: phosphatidylserine decarboxylase [Pirellulales bacterium]|jgi:phosphatidylserine decarboxylase
MSDTLRGAPRDVAPDGVEPLSANITSVQPGGGVCYSLELLWGRARRFYLKTFRPGYVRNMAASRHGDASGAPHEILDPRDLKYCRNLCTAEWDRADDPFAWRDKLPFARWGLAELQIMGWPLLAATIALAFSPWPLAAILTAVPFGLLVYFFRDPQRRPPTDEQILVSPADGRISEITRVEHEPFFDGPAVRIGIFLSIFNVHINRVPARARVLSLRYAPGKFLNALRPESAVENESMWIGLEELQPDGGDSASAHGGPAVARRMIVRQITGQFARRIVCSLRPGDMLARGQQFGMIKLGSRTELILPDEPGLRVLVKLGEKVNAGSSAMARYDSDLASKS